MSSRFVTPTGSDALGAQALVGGKGETCDASLGVAADRGAGVGAAGRDGGVRGRGVGAGGAVGDCAALFANPGRHTASDAAIIEDTLLAEMAEFEDADDDAFDLADLEG